MSLPSDMLLHPELLSNEQLKFIIQSRHLNISNVDYLDRDDLLLIFHKFCVPYGQRKYRDSGRGKVLNQSRKLSPEPVVAKFNVIDNTNRNNRKLMNSDCENRLKPPPDLLSGHFKRIRLDKPISDVNSFKRKMSIDSATPTTDSPPIKKERKLITWP